MWPHEVVPMQGFEQVNYKVFIVTVSGDNIDQALYI